jgi:hypothetical protein
MREAINRLERAVYDTLSRDLSHFDVDVHMSVKDGRIQSDVRVQITEKHRLP